MNLFLPTYLHSQMVDFLISQDWRRVPALGIPETCTFFLLLWISTGLPLMAKSLLGMTQSRTNLIWDECLQPLEGEIPVAWADGVELFVEAFCVSQQEEVDWPVRLAQTLLQGPGVWARAAGSRNAIAQKASEKVCIISFCRWLPMNLVV